MERLMSQCTALSFNGTFIASLLVLAAINNEFKCIFFFIFSVKIYFQSGKTMMCKIESFLLLLKKYMNI